jgi:hypothetical protein
MFQSSFISVNIAVLTVMVKPLFEWSTVSFPRMLAKKWMTLFKALDGIT